MKIPFLDKWKRTVAAPVHAQAAKSTRHSGSRMIWPLALACGLLIFVTGSSVYLVRSSQARGELVNSALRVETKVWVVLNTVRIAESGQRGYLLTGDPAYLDIYRIAIDAIGPAITELNRTIIDPAQHQAVAEIEPLIERKFAELNETIRLYGAGQGEEALALVRKGVGRDLMAEIRTKSLRMLETERHIVDVRSSNASSTTEWLFTANFLGLLLMIALSAGTIIVMRRLAETELSYVRDLERSNQELDDFAYIASHDLKEPLRGLFNHASFLLEDYQDKMTRTASAGSTVSGYSVSAWSG